MRTGSKIVSRICCLFVRYVSMFPRFFCLPFPSVDFTVVHFDKFMIIHSQKYIIAFWVIIALVEFSNCDGIMTWSTDDNVKCEEPFTDFQFEIILTFPNVVGGAFKARDL